MNNKTDNLQSDSSIKDILKEAFHYDEAHLLKEFEQAEQNPDHSPELIPPDNEFPNILMKINRCRAERDGERRKQIRIQRLKKVWRPLLAAAAIGALMFCGGTGVMASKYYWYQERVRKETKNSVVWNNDGNLNVYDDVEEAYIKIADELKIKVLRLEYRPTKMNFVDAEINKGQAVVKFSYKNEYIYLKEVKYPTENSKNYVSDRKSYKTIYNGWIGQDISIEKNKLEDKRVEYSAILNTKEAYYIVEGIMKEKEFIKIIENLSFR